MVVGIEVKPKTIYIRNIKITRFAILLCTVIISFFLISTILVTSLNNSKSIYLNRWFGNLSISGFMYAFEQENHYLTQEYYEDNHKEPLSTLAFSLLTNIRFNDIRSFIRNEIPGYANYYSQILVAGEGTNLTNIPQEPDVSLEELQQDHKVNTEEVEKYKDDTATEPSTNGKKVIFIYHTHSRESFFSLLPEVSTKNPDSASSSKANVSLLGERLKKKLEESGIGATDDHTDITQMLLDNNLKFPKSYDMSRTVVEEAMSTNEDIEYLIDIHRDSARKNVTTKEINGESYARLYFIVGMENKNREQNLALATDLHNALEAKYKGISRGVFPKDYSKGNGIYNQDLSANSLLIEIGGVDNTMEELYRTVDALAEVLSEYYWQAEKVNN